ncbi:cob(I)yrinic acid a,c-diamide adenosyltransferase, partial [bacterium]
DLIKHTPATIELVLTGRCAPAAVIKAADLVSRIDEVKHYYRRGVKARIGIEL